MPRRQKLITAELRRKLPALGSADNTPTDDVIVHAKFFNPYGAGTWLVTEFDGKDTLFGAVYLDPQVGWEWGYISLSELQNLPACVGGRPMPFQGIERDILFESGPFREVRLHEGDRSRATGVVTRSRASARSSGGSRPRS